MEVIGTTPGKEEVELRREQQPRVVSGTETERTQDAYVDVGGRTAPGAISRVSSRMLLWHYIISY